MVFSGTRATSPNICRTCPQSRCAPLGALSFEHPARESPASHSYHSTAFLRVAKNASSIAKKFLKKYVMCRFIPIYTIFVYYMPFYVVTIRYITIYFIFVCNYIFYCHLCRFITVSYDLLRYCSFLYAMVRNMLFCILLSR